MIVIFKEKQEIKIGYFVLGDSDLYPDCNEEDLVDVENVPMRFVDGKFVAFCDTDVISDIVLYNDEFFKELDFNYKYVVIKAPGFFQSIVDELKRDKDDFGQVCVLVSNGRCFAINADYEVREVEGVICYGAYREYVRSLIDDTVGLSVKERMEKIASLYYALLKMDVYPYVIMDANTGKGKVVYKGGKERGIDCSV